MFIVWKRTPVLTLGPCARRPAGVGISKKDVWKTQASELIRMAALRASHTHGRLLVNE
jgi:hypothetical protein